MFMVVALWLQHSYFQGAAQVIKYVCEVFAVMKERNEKLRTDIQKKQLSESSLKQSDSSMQSSTSAENISSSSSSSSCVQPVPVEGTADCDSDYVDVTHDSADGDLSAAASSLKQSHSSSSSSRRVQAQAMNSTESTPAATAAVVNSVQQEVLIDKCEEVSNSSSTVKTRSKAAAAVSVSVTTTAKRSASTAGTK